MSMMDCNNLPAGAVVPSRCRPVRAPSGQVPSRLPDRLGQALTAGGENVWNLAAFGVRPNVAPETLTERIQQGIDESPTGSTVWFPAGVYEITEPVRLLPGRAYAGAGRWGTVIRQADQANIVGPAGVSGVLVPQDWWQNSGFSGEPISLLNLRVDGNRSNNPASDAAGIVLCNYYTVIDGCMIEHTPVDGVLLTDSTRDGTVIGNSSSENRVTGCRIYDAGRHGIHQALQGQVAHLDGYLTDCTIDGTAGDAVRMDRAAGWVLRRLHAYNVQTGGLVLSRCHGTIVTDCQVEQFGREAAAGVFYAGISAELLGVWGTQIVNNFVSCEEPSDQVGAYAYYAVAAASGQTASVVLDGNIAQAPAEPGSQGRGLVLEAAVDGSTLRARLGANAVAGMATPSVISEGVVTLVPDRYGVEHADVGGDVASRFPGDAVDGGPAGGAGGDLAGTLTWGTGAAPTAGDQVGVSYTAGFDAPPTVQVTPVNDATAGLGVSVTSHEWGFVVRATNPPAGSQPDGTFGVAYAVH